MSKVLVIYQDWGNWFTDNYNKFEYWFKYLDGAYSHKIDYYVFSLGNRNSIFKKEKNMIVELFRSSPIQQLFDLFKFKKRLKEIIKEQKPDYIYVYFSYLASMVPRSKDYKTITFIRDKTPEMIKAKGGIRLFIGYFFYFLDYLGLKNSDIALHNGKTLEKYIKKLNFKGKIVYSPRPVQDFKYFKDYKKSDLLKKYSITNQKIILSIARLTKAKNIDLGIRALSYLPKDYMYIICGEGEERFNLEKLAKELNVFDRVIFMGYFEHKYVWQFFKLADIFWLLSKTDFEGTPNVLQEAAMAKVPCIVSNRECMKNIIEDNYNGLILDGFNPEKLAEKSLSLLNNDELYKFMQINNFNKVKEIIKKRFEIKSLFR